VNYPPVLAALLATLFTWGVTALGAAGVFLFRSVNQRLLDAMLGFAAGVMIAASYWSLLAPAIAISAELGHYPWLAPAVGFISGGAFLWVIDRLLPHLHQGLKKSQAEGVKTNWHKTQLLFLAITLHNFPEGLAIGVAFGAASLGIEGALFSSAVALAIGIGIQNFPEGFAVSVPFRREGFSRAKSFFYGQASAWVEPVAAVLGAALVGLFRPALPYTLAFAAGAMIYVTVEEVIPEAQSHGTDVATVGAMIGFTIMMVLDVALG
jgi:ZIP family zinc transporter